MTPIEDKTIKLSDLFTKWIEFIKHNVETDGLDIVIENSVTYESVEYGFTDIRSEWSINYKSAKDLTSLRTLSEFDTYLMMLNQNGVHINIDVELDDDYVTPNEEPEADFN